MAKKYLIRRFAITCLCLISLLIKSEDKNCKANCVLLDNTAGIAYSSSSVEVINEGSITYYGFYSKF